MGNGDYFTDTTNFNYSYPVGGSYTVTLYTTDSAGCNSSYNVTVGVHQNHLKPVPLYINYPDGCEVCLLNYGVIMSPCPRVDSSRWEWGDGTYIITTEDTACHEYTSNGTFPIILTIYAALGSQSKGINVIQDIVDCDCLNNSDCDDNNGCTIDQCYQGQCRNQKGYSSLGSVSLSWWRQNCCCN